MLKRKKVVIFGTGEIGELAKFYFSNDSIYEVVAFSCDDQFITQQEFQGLPVVPFSLLVENYPPFDYEVHIALSYRKLNHVRKTKFFQLKTLGYKLASYVCSRSVYWPDLKIGENCFILENQTIQPGVIIGDNVMIWSGNHLGHSCFIGDHTYLSSHICISGQTRIGESCFVGVNSSFKDFLTIGSRVFIAMGAVVTKNINDDAVVLAATSAILDRDDELALKLKARYFNL